MDLREALALVADDVDRSRLAAPAQVRARGDRLVGRRRTTALLAGAAAVVLVLLGVVLGGNGLRALPGPIQRPTPRPTQTVAPLVVRPGCGLATACPQGTGPFVLVLGANRGGDHLSVGLTLPTGWSMSVSGDHAVVVASADRTQGLTMLWPTTSTVIGQDARALAADLATLPGSAEPSPRRVVVDGHVGWQVTFTQAPPGAVTCIDPAGDVFAGDVLLQGRPRAGHCRALLQLSAVQTGVAVQANPVGIVDHLPVAVTLVDGLGVREAGSASMLTLWRWGGGAMPASPRGTLLDGMRLGHFADPACSADPSDASPVCATDDGGVHVSRGDPVETIDGIHAWHSQAIVHVPAGWHAAVDDGWGSTFLDDSVGQAGGALVWEPRVPGPPSTTLADAQAWASRLAADPTVVRVVPQRVTVAGRPAWRVDLVPRLDVYPFREARDPTTPFEDTRCGDGEYYARSLVCTADQSQGRGVFLEADMTARVWFVQAAPGRVLMVMVWGKHLHHGQPPALPPVLALTAPMLQRLSLTTT